MTPLMSRSALLIFILALLALSIPTLALALQPGQGPGHGMRMQGDFEWYYMVHGILSTVNLVLLVVLFVIYLWVYSETRSEFALGLVIFSAAMMMYAVTSIPWLHHAFGFDAYGLGPFAFFPDLFVLAALIVLLSYALRYR